METYAVEWTTWFVHTVLFWETDDVRKGEIVRTIHHAISYLLFALVVISHTIYPAFWLQTIVFFFCVCIWIQHVLTNGCIISKVEQKLIGDTVSFIDPFLHIFRITVDEPSKPGILILGSTIGVTVLGLEWCSRVIHKLIPLVLAQFRVFPTTLNTLVPLSSP